MKTPAQFLCRRLTFLFMIAGLALFSLATAFAQKTTTDSPNQPKIVICHQGYTITVTQSLITPHLQHGDTLGACPSEPSVVICHRGSTITVLQSQVQGHLDHGDTIGPCSSFAGGPAKITPIAPSAPAGGRPVSVAPSTIPTPVVQEDVVICYKGHNVTVTPASLQTYLSIGAKLGRCPQQTETTSGQK